MATKSTKYQLLVPKQWLERQNVEEAKNQSFILFTFSHFAILCGSLPFLRYVVAFLGHFGGIFGAFLGHFEDKAAF
jgi:hypothetical protein